MWDDNMGGNHNMGGNELLGGGLRSLSAFMLLLMQFTTLLILVAYIACRLQNSISI